MNLSRKFLWSSSCLCCLEIGSSVHRLAMAAQSTHKHFMDISAVKLGGVQIANMNQQQWHYLAETARPQPQHKSARGTKRDTRRSSQLCRFRQSEDQQRLETSSQLYKQAKLSPHHCPSSPIYMLQTSHVLYGSCFSMCLYLS